MKTFDKYKQNLRQIDDQIYSYDTHVATIDGDNLNQLGWWSVTTQKHINYVANHYGYPIVEMDLGEYETGHLNIKNKNN